MIALVFLSAMACRCSHAVDGFSVDVIERTCERVAPAIGLLSYTAEVTSPASGTTARRERNALGLVVASDGLVITHGHLFIEDTEPVDIRFTIGQSDAERDYEAKLLRKPDDVNLCFLRLLSDAPLDLPAVHFDQHATLRLGEPVMVIGLLSQTLDYARSVFGCRVGAILDKPRLTYCLDQSLRFGFVTGPVFNTNGAVVGVVGFDLSTSEGGDLYVRSGHPLVYQAALFQHYIDQPPTEHEIITPEEPAWLGVFTQPLKDDFAEYWGLPKDGGVIVSTVVPGSPAEQVGLVSGDVITHFAGVEVRPKLDREVMQFTKLVRESGVGNEVDVRLLRNGERMELKVMLSARPKAAGEATEYDDEVFGLTVRELTTDVRILMNLPDAVQGVIVRRVKSGSVAQQANMRPGIIIMNFGGHPITNIEDFKKAILNVAQQKPDEVAAFCRAGTLTGFFRLEPRW